jgi:hypothetical protein
MPLNAVRRSRLASLVPEGMITSRQWLMEKHLSRHAIDNLVKSGQLEVVANGAYARPPSVVSWQAVVCSLQTMFHFDLVVGGLTALELQGLGHYIPMSSRTQAHLYISQAPPSWLSRILKDVVFIYHSNIELLGRTGKKSQDDHALGLYTTTYNWKQGMRPLVLSTTERAILEVMAAVPKYVSFEHAEQLMQAMTALSPRRLQELLEKCHNIKVRRLFLWMAERQNYPWLHKLERDKIDLGSGNRMLFKGGRLDKKYKITVPRQYE